MRFSITHSKITSPPESEDEFKVAKSKSISGSQLSAVTPQGLCTEGFCYDSEPKAHTLPELPALPRSLAFSRGDATEAKQHRSYPSDCYVVHTPPISLTAKKFHLQFEFIFFPFFFSPLQVQSRNLIYCDSSDWIKPRQMYNKKHTGTDLRYTEMCSSSGSDSGTLQMEL